MTGDKVAEVSVKGGKGRVLWRPSRSFDAGASERAVPPWAEPDAQAPPPPSNFYASVPSASMTSAHMPVRPLMGMATGVQADPNPTHFNRPSPGASPVPFRKCLFRMNAPTRSLSNESLHKTLPWVAKRSEPPPAGDGQETDTLCPMIMTGDSRSRMEQMRGRGSTRSASLPRVGRGAGESFPSQTVAGGVGNVPAGRGMQEAPPQPQPTQSETAGGRGANEPQNVPRPQSHSRAGIKSSPHTGADPPDRADVRHHPPGRMVSAKPTVEAKAAATSALPSQQPEQSSPTPWRKMRPAAPTESTPPPEKSSPTPWRKNVKSQDASAKAAPSVQKQQQSTKDNVSAGSAFESDTADASSTSSAKTQDAPWRKASSHQTISAESSSSQSVSSVTESKSTSFKQTQVIQTSHISVGVSSEEASKITASTDASVSKQSTQSQPSWRRQQPKNQSTALSAPTAEPPVSQPSFTGPTPPAPAVFQPSAPVTVPQAKNVTQTHLASKQDTAIPSATRTISPVPATGKSVSPVPFVSPSPSPIPGTHKTLSPLPGASKPASPVPTANKSSSPAPAVSISASQTPATSKLAVSTPAPVRPSSPALVADKPASPVPAANKPASPAPAAAHKPASPAPAANKPASPAPAANKPASPAPAASHPASPALAVNKPASPAPAVNIPPSPTPSGTKPAEVKPSSVAEVDKQPSVPLEVDKSDSYIAAAGKSSANLPTSGEAIPVSNESVTSVIDANQNVCSLSVSVTKSTKISDSEAVGRTESVADDKQDKEGGVTPSLSEPEQAPKQPLAPTALHDTRSPTPPLPPKQTAASIVSAPAVPLAPKPPLAPVDQPIIPPPTFHPIPPPPPLEPIPPPPPTQPKLPTLSAPVPPPPPPLPSSASPVQSSKVTPSMTSVVFPPMPVPSPPPGIIPIPPPEPVLKSVKSSSTSPGSETQQPSVGKVSDAKGTKESAKSTESSKVPQPEFPPPPPLEESAPPGPFPDMDQALPPPPSFVQDHKPLTPPASLPMDQGERPAPQGDEFPSPEYVRESVTKRIKAFEKQASRDEEPSAATPPPADRQGQVARPVAPWVKKTSSGPVNQDSYWDMTSPEGDPGLMGMSASTTAVATAAPSERDVEQGRSRPKPQVPSAGAKGAPTPPPTPPSVPSAKGKEPRTQSPSFHRPRHPAAKPRSISIGDIEAQYLTPVEDHHHRKMPAEGGEILAATAPEEAKQSVKSDDALYDPWCDPKHPRVINFQDVSAAAFKIKSGIMNTPCTLSHMSTFTDMEIYFKKEFNQYTGSFKERGARYTLLMLTEEQRKKGVIAASAGNHALALSYHGQDLGIPVTVVMPLVAPIMKVQACRQYGANIIVRGKDIGECREIALRMSKDQGLLYINGYDHPHILAGQGTMGLEIVEQVKDIDAVVIPVGGGGLIAGVALAVKALYPHVKVIGVESERCASFSEAMKAGRPVYVAAETTLADGLAVPMVGVNAFATASKLVDKVVQVREEWIAIAILRLVECEKAVVEGAGATALAAILAGELPELKGKRIVIPLCGGNIDTTVLGRCLERGLAADGRLVKFTVTVSDRPGGIAELTRLLANLGVSIKDMMHERAWIKNDIFSVEVKVIAETRDHEHSLELRTALESQYRRLRFANPDHIHDDC
ncbi:uncharacterized protein [Macrobrachium rosenbergii]